MRILILGGTGLTGPHTVRRLHSLAHDVTVVHRGEHEAQFPAGVRHVHLDLSRLLDYNFGATPDVVIHMRAMTEADAESFLNAFRGIATRAVVISSGDVYRAYGRLTGFESGPPDPNPLNEDSPLRTSRYPYRKTALAPDHWMAHYDKILVEQALTGQTALPTCILRFPAVIGPGEHRRFQRWLQRMFRGDSELRIQHEWASWRWTHALAEDAAEAVVLAAANPRSAGRIYNVGEAHTPTMAARLAGFATAMGWRGHIVEVPASALDESDRLPYDFAHHLLYDTSRVRAELGYSETLPPDLALARILEYELGT
jgi:nucleoside-diphosphate-sugar epimerase